MGTVLSKGCKMNVWPWYLEPHMIGLILAGFLILMLIRYDDEFLEFMEKLEKWCKKGKMRKDNK